MTLFRMIVILAGALVLLLIVVILRAETTRLHYEISQLERETEQYRQQWRESELELARLRNPMVIRERVRDAVRQFAEEGAPREDSGPQQHP